MTYSILVKPSLFSGNLGWENNLKASKNFLREYRFVFVEYLYKRSPKTRTNHFKNYISILTIVKYGISWTLSPLKVDNHGRIKRN